MIRNSLLLPLACFVVACGSGPDSYGDELGNPQLPPRGSSDVTDWLAQGHYLSWNCEPEAHPKRPGSGHGPNRICTNTALSTATGDGPYPVGAAAVKEIFNDKGEIRQYAIYRKVEATTGGDSWYWYEGKGSDIVANGEGDSTCTGCHGRAPRDFVYTVVP
ncbi:MAG TPA: hypothetical protein VK427_03850 [Kofleriaceae bacterium]|nr:hypothetical protein [Kofleriaceae bacterium]